MPTGVLTSVASPTIIRLPTMALARPPPSEPGAGVDCVNMFQSMALIPFVNSTTSIHSRTNKPSAMAIIDRAIPIRFFQSLWL